MVNESDIVAALDRADRALDEGQGLFGTGFWPAVTTLKRSPELAERLADRVASIDRRAFEDGVLLSMPLAVGTPLAILATAAGVAGVVASRYLEAPWDWLMFTAGMVALLPATHGLAHLVVGNAVGLRFTHWFVGSVMRPQPGVKVDYATYLRTPARRRAWMHASGALVTKVLLFALIPFALAADLPRWFVVALVVVAAGAVVVDAAWSVRSSDWKRFRREMSFV